MSTKMVEFKNMLCDRYLIPIENQMRKMWPGKEPKITLLVRTPRYW